METTKNSQLKHGAVLNLALVLGLIISIIRSVNDFLPIVSKHFFSIKPPYESIICGVAELVFGIAFYLVNRSIIKNNDGDNIKYSLLLILFHAISFHIDSKNYVVPRSGFLYSLALIITIAFCIGFFVLKNKGLYDLLVKICVGVVIFFALFPILTSPLSITGFIRQCFVTTDAIGIRFISTRFYEFLLWAPMLIYAINIKDGNLETTTNSNATYKTASMALTIAAGICVFFMPFATWVTSTSNNTSNSGGTKVKTCQFEGCTAKATSAGGNFCKYHAKRLNDIWDAENQSKE